MPLPSSHCDRVRLCLKKRKKNNACPSVCSRSPVLVFPCSKRSWVGEMSKCMRLCSYASVCMHACAFSSVCMYVLMCECVLGVFMFMYVCERVCVCLCTVCVCIYIQFTKTMTIPGSPHFGSLADAWHRRGTHESVTIVHVVLSVCVSV